MQGKIIESSYIINMALYQRPQKPQERPHCYICGQLNELTDDHLPPKGFFPPTNRENLITAPLCSSCHDPLKKTDEAMRVWLAAAAGVSSAGKWIWQNKVLGSTFRRSPKLRWNIQQRYFRPIYSGIKNGEIVAGIFTIPQGRAVPFIRRLTKGLLYSFYPDYNYFADFFTVNYELPTQERVQIVSQLAQNLSAVQVGDGVFRVWHGITADTGDAGAWVYLFYEAVCFVCFHGKSDMYAQKFEDNYEEEKGLPPAL